VRSVTKVDASDASEAMTDWMENPPLMSFPWEVRYMANSRGGNAHVCVSSWSSLSFVTGGGIDTYCDTLDSSGHRSGLSWSWSWSWSSLTWLLGFGLDVDVELEWSNMELGSCMGCNDWVCVWCCFFFVL
jgi:hypothetical protein